MKQYPRAWKQIGPTSLLLLPLSVLFCGIATVRKAFYRRFASSRLPVPVIVVGNITVGGTGKTPLIIWLANALREQGFNPGILSRGYGGNSKEWPLDVDASSDPDKVGDEPVLIARQTGCPVVVGADRIISGARLLRRNSCDLILCDDGMQHYRLARDIEILVVDGERRFGNGFCLPAGPLREGVARTRSVDFIVTNGQADVGEFGMHLKPGWLHSLAQEPPRRPDWLVGKRVHAVAGVGNPQRFFDLLATLGAELIEHPFPDHYHYRSQDLEFDDGLPVVMTEKDAVKCRKFRCADHWYLPIYAEPDPALRSAVIGLVRRKLGNG